MDSLDRGLVALARPDGGVHVGWRLLATDPPDIAFRLYRRTGPGESVRLNEAPIRTGTNWLDTGALPGEETVYALHAVQGEQESPALGSCRLRAAAGAQPYLSLPLRTPEGYHPNDASVGDLDGDGAYEIVLHQAGRGRDNSQAGETDPPILQAYRLDGTFLWQIDLGRNIREGAHYTQFMVYDLDGDGRAEVACKTADGTLDGQGRAIGDATADHRGPRGTVLRGPEFLTVFDGRTGAALATVDYVPPRAPTPDPTPAELKRIWGDDYGNRSERYLACVAYLDGARPSLVMCRGYYTRSVLAAWDWREGELRLRWVCDSADGAPGREAYAGQGNHNLAVADVDGDGRDEILYGACTIDDDGTGLYSTGLGHGDAIHLSDIDPRRPGLEVWSIHEHPRHPHGANLRDAATGAILWSLESADVGRGMAMDLDPRHPGYECWAAGRGLQGVYTCTGEKISAATPPCNMGIWWDGDLLREVLDGVTISKWDWRTGACVPLLEGETLGCVKNNGTKANPCLAADILGDWREELICRTADGNELRIFVAVAESEHRLVTLMQDPVYRLSVAAQNVGYNLPTQTGFYLGAGMTATHRRPTVFLIGDSTVNTRGNGKLGWGTAFGEMLDAAKATPANRARGGRSSRTYLSEGIWADVLAELRAGDYVLMQFGHNDGGGLDRNGGRASIKGNGEETQDVVDAEKGTRETVHTYGWYLRRYCADARSKGATPIVLSPIPRNRWSEDGRVLRAGSDYGLWAREAARDAGAFSVDLNEIVARRYEALGRDTVAGRFFHADDWTHTTAAGARQNALCVAEGIRALEDCALRELLLPDAGLPPGEH
ncbi:MAG: hypothetical protein JXR77_04815 [Lentisphaeria bacterium]|nr:hypothetical protein [Lentisphaeria bacterium]